MCAWAAGSVGAGGVNASVSMPAPLMSDRRPAVGSRALSSCTAREATVNAAHTSLFAAVTSSALYVGPAGATAGVGWLACPVIAKMRAAAARATATDDRARAGQVRGRGEGDGAGAPTPVLIEYLIP